MKIKIFRILLCCLCFFLVVFCCIPTFLETASLRHYLKACLLGFAAMAAAFLILRFAPGFLPGCRLRRGFLVCFAAIIGLFFVRSMLCLWDIYRCVTYPTDPGVSVQTPFFRGHRVMVIAPHEDDDLNLCGGIIDQYVSSGSEVYVVFATNGDCDGPSMAAIRLQESVNALGKLGVSPDHIIWLGFGDQWTPQTFGDTLVNHIYNSPEAEALWTSACGKTQCYGSHTLPSFTDRNYSRSSYVSSIRDVILEKMPDVIYGVDYDIHPDHRATDLFLEEVLCQILKENPSYTPTVYKTFCYGTSWGAPDDFHGNLNLLSTKKPDVTLDTAVTSFQWEDRVRLPLDRGNLNRILYNNRVAMALQEYYSQSAYMQAGSVLNGDKVFWNRPTDSLLYNADISTDSGPVRLLNDFKLKDSSDITVLSPPVDGIFTDLDTEIHVSLPSQTTLSAIWLYDNPSPEDNILSGYIRFDDGQTIPFGPLNPLGNPTKLAFSTKTTQQFHVGITASVGSMAGLCEIEAYENATFSQPVAFFMPVDSGDNFIYDYWLEPGTALQASIYHYPQASAFVYEDLEVVSTGNGTCVYQDGKLTVTCPEGEKMTIQMTYHDLSTSFTVCTPSPRQKDTLHSLQALSVKLANAQNTLRGLSGILNRFTRFF